MHMRSACFAAAVLALVPGTFAQDADGEPYVLSGSGIVVRLVPET